jgi:hypothetical protein
MSRCFTVLLIFFNVHVWSQLDPAFYGTYVDSLLQESFTIYSMDEVAEDCFLVEYERYSNLQLVQSSSGYGHCHGPNGHMEIKLRELDSMLEVSFEKRESGDFTLILYQTGLVQKVYTRMDFSDSENGFISLPKKETMTFLADGGRRLELTMNPSDSLVAFVLRSNECEKGGMPGVLIPLRGDEKSKLPDRYVYLIGEDCEWIFTFSSDSIIIEETHCEYIARNACPIWSGMYVLSP